MGWWLSSARTSHPIPEESRAIHNITDEELANAPSFATVAAELAEVLRGHIPVAYNTWLSTTFHCGNRHSTADVF